MAGGNLSGYPFGDKNLGFHTRSQAGSISREQLAAAGVSRRQIEGMLANGMLIRRYRGVYLLAGADRGWKTQLHAALLALGKRAVLSHRTAGALWGLCQRSSRIEAIRPGVGTKAPPGILTYRIVNLADDESVDLESLRVTSIARTLLDLATVLTDAQLAAALEAADRQGRLRHSAIRAVLSRGRRKGVTALRHQYRKRDPRRRPTRSDFEHEVLTTMRERPGFEVPETNVTVAGREVDMFWRRKRLMVELDGHRHHAGDSSFNSDRTRDLMMGSRGYRVERISWEMWSEAPEWVLDSIEEILRSLPDQPPGLPGQPPNLPDQPPGNEAGADSSPT